MTPNKKRLPLWPILVVLSVLILFAILNPVCRYFYTQNFVSRGDQQLAEMLVQDFESAGVTNLDKPLFFIGSAATRTNGSCLDLSTGKYDIYSAFAVGDALELNTLESSRYIVEYLNESGYDYVVPTAQDWSDYQDEIHAVLPLNKCFPWYESITETEHCIIVQLSK